MRTNDSAGSIGISRDVEDRDLAGCILSAIALAFWLVGTVSGLVSFVADICVLVWK